jgi:adenylyl- and sulfurtransferase ThiI
LSKYEDCCFLFEPRNPIIKPNLEKIRALEKQFFWQELLEYVWKKQTILVANKNL